jgi:predicted dehydrogenase
MARRTRRDFLKTVAAGAAASTFAISGTKSSGMVLGSNERINVAVAGFHGRGQAHIGELAGRKDTRIIYLIDPDTRLWNGAVKNVEKKGGNTPKCVQDVRKALADSNLDAISIATPNHWHALMTIWACQAGKDVYVEKPCSHNVHEGRIATEIARKEKRLVQHGTQSRSSASWWKLAEIVKQNVYGKLLVSYGLCYKPRGSIKFKETMTPPKELDFNIWLGPASQQPFHENLVHYNWHWFWETGNGDIGNQGVHEMDKARWMIPGATLPKSVVTLGGRFGYKDQGETPNTELTLFDFGGTQLIFEVRGLKTGKLEGQGVGNFLIFEKGIVHDDKFYPKGSTTGEPLPKIDVKTGPGGGDPFSNWVAAIRSRKFEDLNADILQGHYSSALCHLANISYRLGKETELSGGKVFSGSDTANEALARMQEHLKDNAVELAGLKYHVGPVLKFDAASEKFVGERAEEANKFLTRNYRKPFVVPEKVG